MPTREVRFTLKSYTADQWESLNPTLLQDEPGIERDTRSMKFGDGRTAWNDLAYAVDNRGGAGSDSRVGNLADLTTDAKTTLVEAINELNLDGISLQVLYDNAKAG